MTPIIEKVNQDNFSRNWNKLYNSTNQLKQANSVDEVFSEADARDLEIQVKQILNTFLEGEVHHKGIKVYIPLK